MSDHEKKAPMSPGSVPSPTPDSASGPASGESAASRSRRDVLKMGVLAAGASAFAGMPRMTSAYAQEYGPIRLALVGCGGRGTGAASQALSTGQGPVKLHAMADVVPGRLNGSHNNLHGRFGDEGVEVDDDHKFIGFDAFRHAIDTLRPGDIAMCTTHPYCRPEHVEYAMSKGVHVFMEKAFAADPAGAGRILKAYLDTKDQFPNRKIAMGLQCRHSVNRHALIDKMNDGELGQVEFVRAYRMDGGTRLGRRDPNREPSQIRYQITRPIHFIWNSAGRFGDYLIHQIDECCWLMDDWPVRAEGLGGAEVNRTDHAQNLSSYSVEYTYADGRKAFVNYRGMPNCRNTFVTYVNGTERAAQFSGDVHRGDVHIFADRTGSARDIHWRAPNEPHGPWQAHWNNLIHAIRHDEPFDELERGIFANYAMLMGRAAVHTGQVVTWSQITQSNFRFLEQDVTSWDDQAPFLEDDNGFYEMPVPGQWQEV